MSELDYEQFEIMRLNGIKIAEIARIYGISRDKIAHKGFNKRFNAKYPDKAGKCCNPRYAGLNKEVVKAPTLETTPIHNIEVDTELIKQVQQTKCRKEKYAIIWSLRKQLIADYGKNLLNVPNDDPRLVTLQKANQTLE
ncbi:hypothetical protein JOC36_000233 [Weissella uvarum]|uniref:hypothetical protein n=1 Tax=Weissella uvarum TaxID=1479233 RepID=UPI001961C4FB|nr:hypothetical protein [Weissella uvarum]MBM7616700.1 hypothetical protein [Weissella uvarum]MCM0594845.1 hypothetical protein [Weissella uvarum]